MLGGRCLQQKNICSVPEECCGPIFVMHTQKCRTRFQIQICFFFCTAQFQSNALFWIPDSVSIYYSHISHIVSMQIDSQGLNSIRIFATSLSLALKHAMQIPVHAGKAKNMTRCTSFQIIASQQWQYHTALAMTFTFSSKFRFPFRSVSVSRAC